jgi:hypothetical protein
MPPHSTPRPSSFEETPTPTDLKATMAACRLNLNALLSYMVGKHGLEPETATRYFGRSAVKVLRDFRLEPQLEPQMGKFLSDPDFQTQPIPLVNAIGKKKDFGGVLYENTEDSEIEIRFAEMDKDEKRRCDADEKDALESEDFFSDPDPEKTPIRDTRILQRIEEKAAAGLRMEGEDDDEKDAMEDEKTTPIAFRKNPIQPVKPSGRPLALPPLKFRKLADINPENPRIFVTPTPAPVAAVEPELDSLTSAILHFAEAESLFRITRDGRAEVTEKLEMDFSDL